MLCDNCFLLVTASLFLRLLQIPSNPNSTMISKHNEMGSTKLKQ